jgi:hypothetical protein
MTAFATHHGVPRHPAPRANGDGRPNRWFPTLTDLPACSRPPHGRRP